MERPFSVASTDRRLQWGKIILGGYMSPEHQNKTPLDISTPGNIQHHCTSGHSCSYGASCLMQTHSEHKHICSVVLAGLQKYSRPAVTTYRYT